MHFCVAAEDLAKMSVVKMRNEFRKTFLVIRRPCSRLKYYSSFEHDPSFMVDYMAISGRTHSKNYFIYFFYNEIFGINMAECMFTKSRDEEEKYSVYGAT